MGFESVSFWKLFATFIYLLQIANFEIILDIRFCPFAKIHFEKVNVAQIDYSLIFLCCLRYSALCQFRIVTKWIKDKGSTWNERCTCFLLCLGSGTIVVMDTTCVCVTVSRAHAHMESVTGNRSRTMDFSYIDILIREMVSEFKRLLAYFEWLRRVMDSETHTQ